MAQNPMCALQSGIQTVAGVNVVGSEGVWAQVDPLRPRPRLQATSRLQVHSRFQAQEDSS